MGSDAHAGTGQRYRPAGFLNPRGPTGPHLQETMMDNEQDNDRMVTEYKFWLFDAMTQGIAYSMETMIPLGDIPEYVDAMARIKAWK